MKAIPISNKKLLKLALSTVVAAITVIIWHGMGNNKKPNIPTISQENSLTDLVSQIANLSNSTGVVTSDDFLSIVKTGGERTKKFNSFPDKKRAALHFVNVGNLNEIYSFFIKPITILDSDEDLVAKGLIIKILSQAEEACGPKHPGSREACQISVKLIRTLEEERKRLVASGADIDLVNRSNIRSQMPLTPEEVNARRLAFRLFHLNQTIRHSFARVWDSLSHLDLYGHQECINYLVNANISLERVNELLDHNYIKPEVHGRKNAK